MAIARGLSKAVYKAMILTSKPDDEATGGPAASDEQSLISVGFQRLHEKQMVGVHSSWLSFDHAKLNSKGWGPPKSCSDDPTLAVGFNPWAEMLAALAPTLSADGVRRSLTLPGLWGAFRPSASQRAWEHQRLGTVKRHECRGPWVRRRRFRFRSAFRRSRSRLLPGRRSRGLPSLGRGQGP